PPTARWPLDPCVSPVRKAARGPPSRRSRRPLPAPPRTGLPEPLRGVRAAADRGDGLRLPCRLVVGRFPARGVRRRSPAVRPPLGGRDRRGGRGRPRRAPSMDPARAPPPQPL